MRISSLGLAALLWSSVACAVAPNPSLRPFAQQAVGFQEEYAKLMRAAETVPPYTATLFGESVNLYSGTTEFAQTDVNLPGNDDLPVSFGRRFVVESRGGAATQYRYAFGDWDMQVPHISGVFIERPVPDRTQDWLVDLNGPASGGESNLRCSGPANVGQAVPPVHPGSGPAFNIQPEDYWQGYSLYVPGTGNQELLFRGNGGRNDLLPTDGLNYPWVTKDRWYFACIPLKNADGEGFMARSPSGITYYFDHIAVLPHPGIVQGYTDANGNPAEQLVNRSLVRLYPTRVVDRFRSGSLLQPNSVTYTWNIKDRLTSISASDGRLITITYANDLISTVSDQSRQWTYSYATNGLTRRLASVQMPDNTSWQFSLNNLTWGETYYADPVVYDGPACDPMQRLDPVLNQRSGSITHPSGVEGAFSFDVRRHGRTSVTLFCISGDAPHNRYPLNFDTLSLMSKHISGTGVNENWTYSYAAPSGCMAGDTCPDRKTTTVTAPDGSYTVNTYGIRYETNESQLLETAEYASGQTTGDPARWRQFHYVTNSEMSSKPFTDTVGLSPQPRVDTFYSARQRPLKQRVTVQDGASFQWEALTFDYFTRPLETSRGSTTLGTSNRERTAYHDDMDDWLLGQVASVHHVFNDNSTVLMRQNQYNAGTSTLQSEAQWGKVRKRYTYGPQGTLASVTDGDTGAAVTAFSDYHRGIPRRVDYADGSFETATVGNYGQLESVTDERGSTTRLYYWPSGRLQRIAYPQSDSVAWNDTNFSLQAFSQGVTNIIDGPHWELTVTTGPKISVTYLDELWRPVVTQQSDSADSTRTSYVKRVFDHENREIATSVAVATAAELVSPGLAYTRNSYDAIGRLLRNEVDTELSGADAVAETRYTYMPGFQRKVRNPRGYETTTSFMAWDEPTYDYPTSSTLPEGVNLTIQRDAWGLPQNVLRQGSVNGSSHTVTRHYAYDEHKRLCLSSENESGTTVINYDTAGRIDWTANGLPLNLTTTGCLRETVGAGAKSQRYYTSRDWLRRTTFPNAPNGSLTPEINSYFFEDGALREQHHNGSIWSYEYNKRGLLEKETLQYESKVFVLDWAYNGNGDVQSLVYPNGLSVDYQPDAFGRPTRSGSYASNVRYHPNGGMKSFTYGNGSRHELVQNRRGLPLQATDREPLPSNTQVVGLAYVYDVNGNVDDILDMAGGNDSRSMTYDGLDRLTSATGPWPLATYTYDAFDNLRSAKVGVRDYRHVYDMAVNRVTRITDQNGSTLFNLGYDARGNVTSKGAQSFVFDAANRLVRAAAADGTSNENYTYDGHGRRVGRYKDGETEKRYSVYSKSGRLLHELDRQGNPTSYIYLGERLVAREGISFSEQPPATISVTPNPCGDSCQISWSAVVGAQRYQLQQLDTEGGGWQDITRPDATPPATTHTLSNPPGGSYQFRVASCFAPAPAACVGWRTSTTVGITPRRVTLSGPSGTQGGSFSLSWNSSKSAQYTLERNAGAGWLPLATGLSGNSQNVTESSSGNYQYRIKAYNSHGDRGWSAPVSVAVQIAVAVTPPAQPATITVSPAISYDGLHTVSWSAASGSGPISYPLERSADSGASWQLIVDQAGTSWTTNPALPAGRYSYRVAACNSAGCSAKLTSQEAQVILLGGSVVISASPNPSTSGHYAVSWSVVEGANRYRLDERVHPSATWSQVADSINRSWNATDKASGTYYYRVWACRDSICGSAPSAQYEVLVDRARPAVPTRPSVSPAQQQRPGGANVTVRWSAVPGATHHKLRRDAEVDQCHASDFEITITQQPDSQNLIAYAGGIVSSNCSNPDGSPYVAEPAVYGFSVAACNANGCSAYSEAGQAIVTNGSQFEAVEAAQLIYYHTDALGSPVAEIDGAGQVTRFSYEPYGAPSDGIYTDRPGYTSHVGDSHARLIYMQQRYYDPMIGKFFSVDPINSRQNSGANFNRYMYANNNPNMFVDPDGQFSRGSGFTDKEWKKFDRAQQRAARNIERAASKIMQALKTGQGLKSVVRAFEKNFGSGSGTAANMSKVASDLSSMAAALRDTGPGAIPAIGMTTSQIDSAYGGNNSNTLAAVPKSSPAQVIVNTTHSSFGSSSRLSWSAGHETAHAVLGYTDAPFNGSKGYKYGDDAQRKSFKDFPHPQRLTNPDHLMDFVQ